MPAERLLKIANATIKYRNQVLFADLDFEIRENEHWAGGWIITCPRKGSRRVRRVVKNQSGKSCRIHKEHSNNCSTCISFINNSFCKHYICNLEAKSSALFNPHLQFKKRKRCTNRALYILNKVCKRYDNKC